MSEAQKDYTHAPADLEAAGTQARNSRQALLELLDTWVELGWLRATDLAFATILGERRPEASPLSLLAAALVSHQVGQGHVLLDLARLQAQPARYLNLQRQLPLQLEHLRDNTPTLAHLIAGTELADWQQAIADSGFAATPDAVAATRAPLVLAGHRLYLLRYWQFEQQVETGISARADAVTEQSPDTLRPLLDALFPAASQATAAASDTETDWQKLACALATRSRFAVITGGPGTGKTTTVLKLLALLQALQLQQQAASGQPGTPLQIRLAAPTGKAAARLNESIRDKVGDLPLAGLAEPETLRAAIPTQVQTVHRLLGLGFATRHGKYNRNNPLPVDAVVVDEASMVDEELMARLIDALPPHARLILVGDKDQLASVEAGAVLGSLCARAHAGHYPPAVAQWLASVNGRPIDPTLTDPNGRALDASIAMLRRSYRFRPDSGIQQLAQAINQGDAAAALDNFKAASSTDLIQRTLRDPQDAAFKETVSRQDGWPSYQHYLQTLRDGRPADNAMKEAFDTWAAQVLQAHGKFQLLTALRTGDWGVNTLNTRIAGLLARQSLLPAEAERGGWYEGRPVLVTRNDYGLNLMNGDIGIVLRLPADPGSENSPMVLRIAFPRGDGSNSVRWVLPSRLQHCETVFAMTVHKSQGSEFQHAALLLPDTTNPVLTRELIYTAVTRASAYCTLLVPDQQVLSEAVRTTIERETGLFE